MTDERDHAKEHDERAARASKLAEEADSQEDKIALRKASHAHEEAAGAHDAPPREP